MYPRGKSEKRKIRLMETEVAAIRSAPLFPARFTSPRKLTRIDNSGAFFVITVLPDQASSILPVKISSFFIITIIIVRVRRNINLSSSLLCCGATPSAMQILGECIRWSGCPLKLHSCRRGPDDKPPPPPRWPFHLLNASINRRRHR